MFDDSHKPDTSHSVGMGLLFWPSGGSAQVASYLSHALDRIGWHVTLATGSLGRPGTRGNAGTFFTGVHVAPFAYDGAVVAWKRGGDPMDSRLPMHPSYEDRVDELDRIFTDVSPAQFAHATDAWMRHMQQTPGFLQSDVLHLHHLSVLQLAARRAAPTVPIVSHLHGTELKMLAAIAEGVPGVADRPHATTAAALLRAAAATSDATIVVSPYDRAEALRLLDLDPETMHVMPNGVDVEHFQPSHPSPAQRRANWKRWLVEDPQGWDSASTRPGSIAYDESVLDRFVDPVSGEASPVLLYVGRFLDFKRVPLLVRAYALAQPRFERPAPLVVWGGMPGECDGEHPHDVARALGVEDVFFVGWRGHDELPTGLGCAAALVAPSVDEPFGLVYLEAMACGLPVVGTTTGGPPSFVNVDATAPDGWLVEPDDVNALADALVTLVNQPDERRRRGEHALRHVRASYAWSTLATRLVGVYEGVIARRRHPSRTERVARRAVPRPRRSGAPPRA